LTAVRLQVLSSSPRVRLLHDFVTAHEAAELIALAAPGYHRSSTARAGSDDKRTSNSATLPSTHPVVAALRQRIAFFCGYPEPNLEPLQAVRYLVGEYYKPHHDYYNACETWLSGNRHFTFLIYLNEPEAGGETAFPRLNLTVAPRAFTALVFNNCLDNGEPDERTLHEGVAPERGIKYAM
jgi:prolyl 4-hydroxylase